MSSHIITFRELATHIRQGSEEDYKAFALILDNMAKTEFSYLGNEVYSELERRSSHYFATVIDNMRVEAGMAVRNKVYDMEAAFNEICVAYTDTKGATHEFPNHDEIEILVAFITFTYLLQMERIKLDDLALIEDAYMDDFGKPGFVTNKEYVEYISHIVERYDATLRRQFMESITNPN